MDGVNVALGSRGMTVEAARQRAKNRRDWRALVHKYMIDFHSSIFDLLLITWRGVGCRCVMQFK